MVHPTVRRSRYTAAPRSNRPGSAARRAMDSRRRWSVWTSMSPTLRLTGASGCIPWRRRVRRGSRPIVRSPAPAPEGLTEPDEPGFNRRLIANSGMSFIPDRITPLNLRRRRHPRRALRRSRHVPPDGRGARMAPEVGDRAERSVISRGAAVRGAGDSRRIDQRPPRRDVRRRRLEGGSVFRPSSQEHTYVGRTPTVGTPSA